MRIYYAHFIGIYNTKQEERDLQTLKILFPEAEIINPSNDQIQNDYRQFLASDRNSPSTSAIDYFCDLVKTCDVLAFRGCVNGKIGAGIWKEIETAKAESMPIIELPSYLDREMTVTETRQLLREFGTR